MSDNMTTTETIIERVRPYKLRELHGEDVFPMLNIIKKIGFKEFKECFDKDALENIVDMFMKSANPEKDPENNGDSEKSLAAIGITILPSVLDVADVLIGNIAKCENEFYKFLENVSDLTVKEIRNLKMADFIGMIVDVVKKEEFKDFFRVASELFK